MAKYRIGFVSNSSSSSFLLVGYLFDEDLDLENLMKTLGYEIDEEYIKKCIQEYGYTREKAIRDQLYEFRDFLYEQDLYLGIDYEDGVPEGYTYMLGKLLLDTNNDINYASSSSIILEVNDFTKDLQGIKDKLNINDDIKFISGERCC